jgi:mono/diheme cytochrome c family protein
MRSARSMLIATAALLLIDAAASGVSADSIDKQEFGQIQRGRYLTTVGDCAACHTLPGSGQDFAGGRPIETPFGLLLAPNITPDPDTGVGAWTDDEFVNALVKGTGRDGKRLYPAMPYTYYTKLTHDDALAIRAYLNTVPPVRHLVKSNQLPFPFDVRVSLVEWDALFFKPGTFQPDPNKSGEWNRGAYLAEGLNHCGLCHTPKDVLGGDKTRDALRGYALQGWFAPDITNNSPRGLGDWSVDDIVAYLKTGHNSTNAASGLMAEVIMRSTSHMTDADLKAIATYLKDKPSQKDTEAAAKPDQTVMKLGAAIYADECSGCHMANGKGAAGLFPTLNGSAVVQQTNPTSLLHVVLRGARSAATAGAPTGAAMPQFEWILTDAQVAAVLTYVRNAWGNAAAPVSAGDVAAARHAFDESSD